MTSPVPGLFTDLYQLTMIDAYLREDLTDRASFELSIRDLPQQRNFLLMAGLAQTVDYLESLTFTNDAIDHLASLQLFSDALLDYLRGFRFTGDLEAIPDGTAVFAGEPLLTLSAPLPQAQLVETALLNLVTTPTMLASKGARVVEAAQGRALVDFGSRRTHGIDAGLSAAHALYLAGFGATSNVEAGRRFGIPVAGTMAHSFVQAHATELEAFRAYARAYPQGTLLVDTYGTTSGIDNVIALRDELGDEFQVRAVRLDSGDLAQEAVAARTQLDAADLRDVSIFASGGLDEYSIESLLKAGAPIDGFGVGTRVGTSADAPSLESVYKLVEYGGAGRHKRSTGKASLPHRKQVYRRFEGDRAAGDTVARHDERYAGTPLLRPIMREGARISDVDLSLRAARERARAALESLPVVLRSLQPSDPPYPVSISDALATPPRRRRAGG